MTDQANELHQLRIEVHALKARVAHLEKTLVDLHVTVAKTLTYASNVANVSVIFEFFGKDEGEAAWKALTSLSEEIDARLLSGLEHMDHGQPRDH